MQPLASWRERSRAGIFDHRVDLPDVRDLGVRVDWTRFDKAQTLFLMIELSRSLKTWQSRVKLVGDYAEWINDSLEKFPGLEELPVPQLQAALKTVAVTIVVAEVTSLMIEGSTAMMPGRIDEFYVRIEGKDRRAGDPPLTIEKDDKPKKLEVFITYSTNGGALSTPWNALEMLVPRLLKHPKVARAIEAARKRAGAAAANLERQIEARVKADAHGALRAELQRLYKANEDSLKEYGGKAWEFAKSSVPEWQVRASKRTTDLNSDRVLFMESNSKNLLKIDQKEDPSGRREREFYLLALAESGGKEAGYHVALKQPLLERLVRLDDRSSASPNLKGTVIVVDPKKQQELKPRFPAGPCANGAGAINVFTGECMLIR